MVPVSKDYKEKGLTTGVVVKVVESSKLKNLQLQEVCNNQRSIDKLLIPPVRLKMEVEDKLERKDEEVGIAELNDAKDSMHWIDISAHGGALINDLFSQTDNGVKPTVVDNTTAGRKKKSASYGNHLSTER